MHRNTPFSNSYRAVGKAQVLTLHYDDWYYLLKHFPKSKFNIYKDQGDDNEKDLEKERKRVQIRSAPIAQSQPTLRLSESSELAMAASSPISGESNVLTTSATAAMQTTKSVPEVIFTESSKERQVTADIEIEPRLISNLNNLSSLQEQDIALFQNPQTETPASSVSPLSKTKDARSISESLREEEKKDREVVSVGGTDNESNVELPSVLKSVLEVHEQKTVLPRSPITEEIVKPLLPAPFVVPLLEVKNAESFSESLKDEEEKGQKVFSNDKTNNKFEVEGTHSISKSMFDLQEQKTQLPQSLTQEATARQLLPTSFVAQSPEELGTETSVTPLSEDVNNFVKTMKKKEKDQNISLVDSAVKHLSETKLSMSSKEQLDAVNDKHLLSTTKQPSSSEDKLGSLSNKRHLSVSSLTSAGEEDIRSLEKPLETNIVDPIKEMSKDGIFHLSETEPQSFAKTPENDTSVLHALQEEGIFIKAIKTSTISFTSAEIDTGQTVVKNISGTGAAIQKSMSDIENQIPESLPTVKTFETKESSTQVNSSEKPAVIGKLSNEENEALLKKLFTLSKKSPFAPPIGPTLKDAGPPIVLDSKLWPTDNRRESNESSIEYYVSDSELPEEDAPPPKQPVSHVTRKSTVYGIAKKVESFDDENVNEKNVDVPKYFQPLTIDSTKTDSSFYLKELEKELKKKVEINLEDQKKDEVLKKEENIDYLLSPIEPKETYGQRESDKSDSRLIDNKRTSDVQGLDKSKVNKIEDEVWKQQNQGPSSGPRVLNQTDEVHARSALKKRDTENIPLAQKRKSIVSHLTDAAKKILAKDRLSIQGQKDTLMLEEEEQATAALLNKRRSHSELIFKRHQSETIDAVPKASELPELGYKTYDPQGQSRKSMLAFKENITTFEVPREDIASISSDQNLVLDRDAGMASMLAYADDIAMKQPGAKPETKDEEKDKT